MIPRSDLRAQITCGLVEDNQGNPQQIEPYDQTHKDAPRQQLAGIEYRKTFHPIINYTFNCMLQKHKSLTVLIAAAVWLALKVISLSHGTKMDTYCREYTVDGRVLHDCVACIKFDQSREWAAVKDLQLSIAGEELMGHKDD